jgi:tRNA pseudouridine38-40 synthase
MTPRCFALLLAYRGDRFHGFQRQGALATVEASLTRALTSVLDEPPRALVPAGRTDAGVHALGQVVSFRTGSPRAGPALLADLNAQLDAGIWARGWAPVPRRFHARSSARQRWYRYLIEDAAPEEERRRCWHRPGPLDLDAMREAASHLLGQHDFASLATIQRSQASSVCTMHLVEVQQAPPFTIVDVVGDRFVRRMVRALVGTLLEVGDGTRRADSIPSLLAARQRDAGGRTAPARGLYLMEVRYRLEDLGLQAATESSGGSTGSSSSLATLSSICA